MSELDKCMYDAGSDQTIRYILYGSHQVTQTITNISGQSSTRYKQTLKYLFRIGLVVLLPNRHPKKLTSMKCVSLPFFGQEDTSKLRKKGGIDMRWQVKTHSEYQRI